MKTGFLLIVATAMALMAAPAGAATPAQSAAAAAKTRADGLARARLAAEAKARTDAQAAARAKVDAGIAAQKKAAVETFLRSQTVARAKVEAKPAYVLANVPKRPSSVVARAAPTGPLATKPPIYHRHAAGTAAHGRHATASGHAR
jgi:hypothetical protein